MRDYLFRRNGFNFPYGRKIQKYSGRDVNTAIFMVYQFVIIITSLYSIIYNRKAYNPENEKPLMGFGLERRILYEYDRQTSAESFV